MAPTLDFKDYTVAWICALEIELAAARFMLDEQHNGNFPAIRGDDNNYIAGEINGHNIAIASLPENYFGPVSAAVCAAQIYKSFPNLRCALMVGIGGGVPGKDLEPDIRLGDVVIGTPSTTTKRTQGVVAFDLGREFDEGFQMYDRVQPDTGRLLRTTFQKIRTEVYPNDFVQYLHFSDETNRNIFNASFSRPDAGDQHKQDKLYEASPPDSPPSYKLVPRNPRLQPGPIAHYGPIASSSKLMRSSATRDRMRDAHGILCFEMEAAGIVPTIPVGVIRGICDYADDHKTKDWQPYAAAIAAAYAKNVLNSIGADHDTNPLPRSKIAASQQQETTTAIIDSFKSQAQNPRQDTIEEKYKETYGWIWSSRSANGPGFREWVLEDFSPNDSRKGRVFWISGKPGAGKSTLMKHIYEDGQLHELLDQANGHSPPFVVGYFFHELGMASERTFIGFLHSIIYQICNHIPVLAQCLSQLFRNQKARASGNNTIWTKPSLFKALKTLLDQDSTQATIYLVIDGLDECHEGRGKNGDKLVDEVLEFLLDLIDSADSKKLRLRTCIASRPLTTIEDRLRDYYGFRIQDRTAPDISKYVRSEIEKTLQRAFMTLDQQTVESLKSHIIHQSSGVFAWVKLVVCEICMGIREGQTDMQLLTSVHRFPEELQELYGNIFERIDAKGHLESALRYLQIITIYSEEIHDGLGTFAYDPTLLEVGFMDCEDDIRAPGLNNMDERQLEGLSQRTRARLQTHCRSLLEFFPVDP